MTFQVLFAVGLVQLLFFLPELGAHPSRRRRFARGLSTLAALPPTWFFGLYEQLAGTAGANSAALGRLAVELTIGAAIAAVGLYAASYDRLSQRALEGVAPGRRVGVPADGRRPLARGRRESSGDPCRAGVHHPDAFQEPDASNDVRRLRRLRARDHPVVRRFDRPAQPWRGILAAGDQHDVDAAGRPVPAADCDPAIMAIPSEPKARWVFRVCEPADRHAAVSGARDAMLLLVVLPTTVFALVQGVVFWTLGAALSHAAFFVLGRLLAEILILEDRQAAVRLHLLPGNSRIFSLWPIYLLAFFFYTVVFAVIDRALSSRPGKLVWFCLAATVAAEIIVLYRRHVLNALPACGSTRKIRRRSSRAFSSAKAWPRHARRASGRSARPRTPDADLG